MVGGGSSLANDWPQEPLFREGDEVIQMFFLATSVRAVACERLAPIANAHGLNSKIINALSEEGGQNVLSGNGRPIRR